MRVARLAFTLLACSWIVLLLTAPIVAFGAPAAGLVYAFGSFICHQRSERSFHVSGAQLPVCARCFGIYAGAAAGALVVGRLWYGRTRSALPTLIVVAAAPTVVTWASEALGVWSPGNLTRCVAGFPLGAATAITVNYGECVRPRPTGPSPPPLPI